MIIDHLSLIVADFAKSKAFYQKALAPLGITLVMEFNDLEDTSKLAGFGRDQKPEFWIATHKTLPVHLPMHFAFLADNRKTVDAFYDAAIDAGGKDNGAPGVREIYHPHYYGAFVICPDGHNVEAVCHAPE